MSFRGLDYLPGSKQWEETVPLEERHLTLTLKEPNPNTNTNTNTNTNPLKEPR